MQKRIFEDQSVSPWNLPPLSFLKSLSGCSLEFYIFQILKEHTVY